MREPKRIERRVMNSGGPVVLAVVHIWDNGQENDPSPRYFVDGVEVWPKSFDRVVAMLALPQGPAL